MDPLAASAGSADLAALGWDPGWASAFSPFAAAGWAPARVVAADRDAWLVASSDAVRVAVVAGRLRHSALGPGDLPAVGDWVAVHDPDGTGNAAADDPALDRRRTAGPAVIQALVGRRTVVGRAAGDGSRRMPGGFAGQQVLAANVDVALVVAGLDGDFNVRRIERYLAVAWAGGVTPVIVLNKGDLIEDADALRLATEAVAPGVTVRVVSALTGGGVETLASDDLGPGVTSVVVGSSGAGKSTLVNRLIGHDRQRTAAVRADDSRGRHTTTRRELVRLPGGGLLIDTPGLRSLGVARAADGLPAAFADIADLAEGCRFRDCRHDAEPGCRVQAALVEGRLDPDRLASHRRLEREAAHTARTSDPLARAAERRRWKAIQASVNIHLRHKYGSDR